MATAFRGVCSAGCMSTRCGVAPRADFPHGERRHRPPEIVNQRKYPVIAMPVFGGGNRSHTGAAILGNRAFLEE